MSARAEERDVAFARAVLAKKLATREQAEECVRVARDLVRHGKPLPIEEVFLRKGYLRRPEALKLARALDGKAAASRSGEGVLELAEGVGANPEPRTSRRKCPNCDKDPGNAFDYCPRCGADLETGGPGPQATICTSCSRIVRKDAAVCPRCATALVRSKPRRTSGAGWLDRGVLLVAALGCFYFLVYRTVIAPPAPAPLASEGGPAEPPPPAEAAAAALEKGDVDAAVRALEEAVRAPDHDPALDLAYVAACRKAGKPEPAKQTLLKLLAKNPKDARLAVLLAEVLLDQGALEDAGRALEPVAERDRDDAFWRARVRLADGQKDERAALDALAKLGARQPVEGRRLAQAALVRATTAFDAENFEVARRELESALTLAPDYAPARERLGVLLLSQKKPREARLQFEKAAQLAPGDPAPRLGLGLACEQTGDRGAAREAYRKFLDLAGKDARFGREAQAVEARVKALD